MKMKISDYSKSIEVIHNLHTEANVLKGELELKRREVLELKKAVKTKFDTGGEHAIRCLKSWILNAKQKPREKGKEEFWNGYDAAMELVMEISFANIKDVQNG